MVLCPRKPTVHHARGVGEEEEEEARIHRDDLSSLSIFHSFLPRAVLENCFRDERIHPNSKLSRLGDPYVRGKGFVGIKFTIPFQYKPLILKRNFKMGVNKNYSMTIRVTL